MRNYIGNPENGSTDWNAILTNANKFVETYLNWRIERQQPTGQPAQGGSGGNTVIYQPPGMSSTTKTLLIGGAVIAAGLLIYSMTKKK